MRGRECPVHESRRLGDLEIDGARELFRIARGAEKDPLVPRDYSMAAQEMSIATRARPILAAHTLQDLAGFSDLFHAECAEQVPTALSSKARPVDSSVSPEQAPEQQDVVDGDALEGSGPRIGAPIAIAEPYPVGVGVRTASADTSDKRKAVGWIAGARLWARGRERYIDERSVLEERAPRFGAVARVRADVDEID